jgi:hypothetical protein
MNVTCQRFHDAGKTFWDFTNVVLVRCPRCRGQGSLSKQHSGPSAGYRFVCAQCACLHELSSVPRWDCLGTSEGHATFLGLKLWLQTACRGRVFWALNYEHMAYIADYIKAQHRERTLCKPLRIGRLGFRPTRVRNGRNVVGRLPRWLVLKSSRAHVLRAIAKLQGRGSPVKIG